MEFRVSVKLGLAQLKVLIRDVPDFPKPGIVFKDITPLLSDSDGFSSVIEYLAALVPKSTTKIAAIESRGFILGSAVAVHLGLGMVLVRKPGKLPRKTLSHSYALEYGEDTLQIHADALGRGDQVCIVDDVLATGGTVAAAEALCLRAGAVVSGFALLMELGFLEGRAKLQAPVASLITY